VIAGTAADDCIRDASSAATKSVAEVYRSSAALASAFCTKVSTAGVSPARTCVMGRGFSVRLLVRMARAFCPVNGGSPASIS